MKSQTSIVLASGSPRRATLLREAGISFDIYPPDIEEDLDPAKSPTENARTIALKKAKAVAVHYSNRTVLAADTMVLLGDLILGKPENNDMAYRMLRSLSGKAHRVITGVAIVRHSDNRIWTTVESTTVIFNNVPDDVIATYAATKEPLDKAGGYAIQGGAAGWIARYEGSYSNIVGLPMEQTLAGLSTFAHGGNKK